MQVRRIPHFVCLQFIKYRVRKYIGTSVLSNYLIMRAQIQLVPTFVVQFLLQSSMIL